MKRIVAILGEYDPAFPPHTATDAAFEHARSALNADISSEWVSTKDVRPELFERFSGLWVAPGSPYHCMESVLWAIRYARESGVPCLGTCGGFQHIIIEYARNVLGFADAQHAEYDPYASRLFISALTCSLAGSDLPLCFSPGSKVAEIYGALSATERYYCNFGVNPDHAPDLTSGTLAVCGSDPEGEIRVVELPGHPFFIGTLFVPQQRSRPDAPHPLISAFLTALVEIGG